MRMRGALKPHANCAMTDDEDWPVLEAELSRE